MVAVVLIEHIQRILSWASRHMPEWRTMSKPSRFSASPQCHISAVWETGRCDHQCAFSYVAMHLPDADHMGVIGPCLSVFFWRWLVS